VVSAKFQIVLVVEDFNMMDDGDPTVTTNFLARNVEGKLTRNITMESMDTNTGLLM